MPTDDTSPRDALLGIALMCGAVLAFAVLNAIVKTLSADYPVAVIIWARYLFHCILILVLFPRRVPTLLVSERKGLQVVRSVLAFVSTALTFFAVQHMPLVNVVAIAFISPLIVTVLSALVLREYVGPRRWAAVVVGFVGVLVIIRPGGDLFEPISLLPLGAACGYGLYQVTTRHMRHAADPLNALFYMAVVGALVTSAAVPFHWKTPEPVVWVVLVGASALAASGHFMMIRAYAKAPAALIAPFAYTEILYATFFGIVLFGDVPDLWTTVGATIIAASGIYVLHRERVRRRAATITPPE